MAEVQSNADRIQGLVDRLSLPAVLLAGIMVGRMDGRPEVDIHPAPVPSPTPRCPHPGCPYHQTGELGEAIEPTEEP